MNNTYTSQLIDIVGLVKKVKAKSFMAFFLLFLAFSTTSLAQQNRTVNPAGSINAGQKGEGLLTKVDSYDNGVDAMLKKYDKQIYFTQNKGQWPTNIRYKADFKFGQALVTDKGMMVGAFDPASLMAYYEQGERQEKATHDGLVFNEPKLKIKGHGWLMNFANASPSMRITNKNAHPDKFNYFYGNGFEGTDVSSYDEVWYNNVYNNVDVRYYPSAEGTLEYDIIVKPGANPANIAINFDGIDKLELTREGHLVLNTSVGAMDLPEPYAYQMVNGKEVKVDAAYALNNKNQLTFTLGSYDTSKPLIIDPIALRWATWVNSNSTGDNHGHGIWVDPSGNIYMVARVDGSTNLITSGAFDTSANGGVDIIVGKYTEPATVGGAGVRVWQTYIGGSNSDNPYVTEMGPDGNLYMAGQTGSTDFPVTGGSGFTGTPINHQSQTGDDIFVLKINPAGNSIKSAVIGGNGTDNAFDLRIATNGDVIVGGFTTSTNLLSQYSGSGATNSNAGGNDALLFRINQNLDAVSWVRNFGGSGADQINILVNNPTTGDIFIAGNTASTSGITAGTPRQGTLVGSTTGFLRRYNSSGTVQWGSYFNSASGGSSSILCMEFNTTRDRLYFAGITTGLGTNNTPSGTYDNSVNGTNDFYVAHMNIDQTFYASTYIGSSGAENNLMGLNVDNNNDVYLFGYVGNDGYPTAGNPLQSTRAGSTDKVFSKINSVLSTLQYSTYYGGANQEEDPVGQRGIKFSNCRIYTIVTAESNDIPLTNGAVTTTKSSSATDIYEPGIVEWANPPDLNNNTIGPNQNICVGGTPALLDGQTPNYVLPTIIRNGTTSAHPALTSGISYQWQSSPDNTTWTNIVGATGEDLTPAQMGALTQTTYYRRVFNGDACVVSPQSNVKVGVFTISAAVVNNTCFGGTAGTITLTPTDGTPGYQYSLNGGAFQSGNVFSGLAAGTYTVNAKDAQNCTATVTVTITQGSEITGNITTTNASCQAVCNGTATVSSVTGGTAPYTYTWLSGGTGATKTGLCAGTNYVVITDAAGCKDTIDFSINTNPPTQISITVTNVYCTGDNSGTATVNILSGTGPYTYLWSNGQTTQTATGLTVGTYTVTVTDGNGCTVSSNAIVQQYSNLVALVSTTEANGGNNGTASVSVYGGTSPYTYLWSNGATTQSITGLATGNYSVTVTDASGNTVTQVFSITTINDIAAGSFIINMGVTPQTFANGLKPYGLIYDLTRNQNVPVKWVIKTSKAKDAADFTINGTDFKSGAFVIEAKYRTPAVNAVISNWVSQGVVGITTTAAVTLPVYKTITTFSNVVVDQQNENLVLPYFANAGLPTSMYTVGLPSSLDGCDDAYIMPHADPTWATHSNLLTFNTTNKGYIWGGCHAPSVLEGIFNPSNSSQRMNFLSSTGLQCYNGNGCGSLITESHGNPTTPYTYQAAYNSDPIMQFMGDLTPSTENGSERWYIPLTTSQWRPTSSPAITTADGVSPRQGVKLVYGPGFGNANNGMVMYEAGHTSDGRGTVASQVAFQRAFFNFLLNAGIQKGLNITANIPQTFVSGVGQTASVTVTGGTAPYTYAWSTACGATIANPTAASTSITFPSLAPQTQCFVTCVVTDACGRRNFVSVAIASQTMPPAPFTITLAGQTNNTCFGACTGAINITPSGATPPYTYTWSNGATTQDLTGLCNGTYTVIVRDANNCTKTATYTITSPTAVSATIGSQTNVLCFGQSTGSVTVNATGGTSPYQYKLGSGSYGSSNTFSGLAAGTYVVTVKDANNCTTTVNVTITQPSSAVSVSISSTTNASCGGSNGALTAVGAGGTTPYQYSLNGGTYQSSGIFSGLTGGSYTITVKDANNCTSTVNATINNNAGPTATIGSQVNVLCFGGATGSVTVSQTGGTSPYQYQLGSGSFQSSAVFNGLTAGTYTFTVKDANNCISTVTTTITQPATNVSGSITSQTNVLCFGNSTGSVTVAGAGGVSPYQYSFNGGTYQSSGTFGSLAAGTYTVTVRDANGCTSPVSVTITQPAGGLTASIGSQTNVLCFGQSTGAVTINAAGGTLPYTYQLGSGTIGSSNTFTGLAAGTYVITVRDGGNCSTTVNVTITQPASAVSGSITSQTNVACNGGNGSVTVAGAGGVAPYQYSFTGGAYQSSGTFSNLSAGSYTVTVRDANNCTSTVPVTITQPSNLSVALVGSPVNVLCFGNSTGSFTVAGSGGTTPYQYSNNGGAYQSSGSFTGLAAGSYVVTVKDNNNCTSTVTVTISQPSNPLSGSITAQTNVLCFGNSTGSVTIAGSGGTAPYQYSNNGGTYQSSGTFGGLAAGSYTVTVRDANGCTTPVAVTINQPAGPLLASSSNQVNVLCFGQSTGSVQINGAGGTSPYEFRIGSNAYGTSNAFTGLAAGTYTFTVRDASGCTATTSVTITQPGSAVDAVLGPQTNVLCFGNTTGSATAVGNGGVSPYTFNINGGAYQASATFNGLGAGTYTLGVKDANGCTDVVTVTITQPAAALNASANVTNASCAGSTNGSVIITATGGTAPYQYQLGSGSFQSGNSFAGLSAGSYTVTVRDNNNCTFVVNFNVSELSSTVSGSITSQTNVLCFGASTGAVTVAGSGGVTPYQYSINGGTFQGSGSFTGLAAGNYFVTVKDANGCLGTVNVTITQPGAPVSGNITNQVNVLCNGDFTGAITITGSGGVGPYQYSNNGGAYQGSGIFTGLAAGTYVVTVRDNNNCTGTVNVTITQPSTPVAGSIVSQTNVLCFGQSTGSVTVSGSGGVGPYQFNINGGSFSASNTFSNLAAGSYTVLVRDANGCLFTLPVTITQPGSPVSGSIVNQTNASCLGAAGSVTVAGSGGTAPYQYSLNGGTFQSSGAFTGLTAGNYTVTVRDANGCTFNVPVNITQPADAVTGSITAQTNVSCFGGNNGAVTVTGAGGVAPYTYSFEGGAFSSTNSFTGLTAGSYDVTVKDNNGCLFVVNVNITQPSAPLSVSITSQTNVSCFGGSNGSVTVIGAGGTPAYVYRIGLGAYQSSGTFNNLAAGTYTITVRDSKLCTSTVTVVITQPSTPVTGTSDDVVPVACYGDASGSFVVIGAGGVAPYTYSFNGGAFNSSNSYVGLVAGTYSVVVRDANGCTSPAVVVTITQPNGALSANIGNQTNILCYGAATGSFSINANGGTAPYQYSLNGGAYNASNTFANLTAGIYLVVVRDANGCTSSPVVVTLTQPNAPLSGSITNSTNVLCFGAATGSATVVAVGGVQPYSYSWNTVPAQTGNTATGLTAGTYTVTVTDFNGCSIQRTVTISQPATPISAAISNITNVSCFGGNNGSATVTASGGTGALSYTWNTNPVQHTATATGLTAGNYIVTITDGNGCTTTRSVTITQPASAVTAALVSQTNVSCFGDNNGSATITASGGTSPLTITWNTVPQQTGFTASNLTPGTYIATATDANGCNATVAVTITGPSQPLSSSIISSTNVTCFGYNNGVAVVSATGGTMPYSYSWSSTPVQTTQVASGLAPGTYIVVITDANNCITTSSVTITGPAAPVAVSIINSVNVACRNEASGSATASASGGTGSLSYTWNTVPAQTGPTATGLVAGTYVVTVVDAFGCSANTSVTITQPATVLTASLLNSGNPTCFAATNGFATVGAQGGNGPYSIVWNTVPQQVGPSATNLGAGNYVAAVTDANGCTRFVNVTLTQPLAAMSGSIINSQNVLCYGDSTGSATVSVSGGTTPYSYSWNSIPSQTGSTATGLPAGTYVVTVTDAQGCSIQRSVTITQPATPISVALVNQHNVTCYGFANGSATVTASGGTGALSYVWNTVPQQVGTSATNLVAGTYVVTVTDVFGCFKTLTVTITQPAAPLSAVINDRTNVLCFGQSTGAATVTVSGGTAPYSFSWNTNPAQTTQTASNLPAGNYIVTVTDANGCVTTASTTISQPATAVNASITNSTNVLCYGNATGSATVSAIGGTPGYTYLWNTVPAQTGPTATGLVAGTYNVTVTDANGCFVVRSVTITQPNAPLSASITNSVNVCPTFATGSATVTASGGTPNYLYSWNTVPAQNSATATGLAAGTYTVTVTDANGCTTTATVTISNNPKPQAGGDQSICQKVSAVVPAGQGEIWSSAPGNPAPAVINQAGAISGMNTGGIYLFILTNQFGCADTVAVTTTANCPLIANPDNAVTNEDTPVNINVPGNDVDPDGNINNGSVTIVDQPDNGTVTVDPVTGAVTYTPNANFNGVDSLIYQICDTGMPVLCDTAYVIINVDPSNDPPIANQDNSSTNEDTPVTILVPGNDTDVDGNLDPTTVTIVDQPSNGTVTIDPVTGVITYDPNPNFNGVDTLIYQICDTGMPVLCDTALVIINVNPVNDPPVANQDNATTPEDTPVTILVPGNDTDNDGNLDPTSVTIVDQPNNGTVTVDPVTGEVIYTPNPNFNGVDTLIYQICDTGMPVLCDTALVIINVTPVNDPPVANQDNVTTPEDTPVTINVPGNDTDVDGNLDPTSVTIVDQPNNGTVTVDPVTGEIIYTPNPNFNGVDTLIYNICDTGLPVLCDTALVIINVTPVNDPPIANTDYANTGEDMPVTIDLPANDTDVDGNLDTTSVTIVTPPVNGTVVINPDGSIVYTPNPNFWGADSLIYQICDTGMPVLCDTAWVYINVETNNDELIAILDTASTPEDTPVTIQVPDNDIDVDNNIDYSSVTIILPPANGTVSGIDPVTGFITYTPNLNFNGTDSLIYQICDLGSPVYCDTAWVYINVGPVNDPPVAVTDTASTLEDTPININIDFNDYDVDGNLDTNSVVIVTPPLFGNAIYDPTLGEIIYTPNANFFGTDSLLYNICDSLGLCDTAWVFITIQSVPDLVLDPSIFPSGNNISCFGANDGSIDLTIDLGVPPYTITWTGPNGFSANTEDISGLAPGTYTVVVVDANVSTATGSITLTEPPLLQSSTVVVSYSGGYNVSCGGAVPACDGSVDLSVVGGSAPYSYSWTGPAGFVAVTQDISGICVGTYTVVVTDANGCTTTQTVTLTAPPALEVGGVALEYNGGYNVSCANACDGSIDLVVNGGVAPFAISWTGPNNFSSSSEDISNLCAGTYVVTVVDANNCSTTATVTLLAPQPLTSGAVAAVVAGGFNITCNGACNGSINATIGGGTAPYSYSWVGPNGFVAITEDLSGLCAGTYVLTVTDANGCTSTSTVTLTQPEVLSTTALAATTDGGSNISCNGACDGSINLTVTGGTAPYTINWVGPNGFVSSLEDISALCVGTYVATVTDANGCTSTVTVTLTEPTPLVSTGVLSSYTGGYNISCNGGNNGSIDVTTTGGSGSYTFNWSGPGGFSANTEDIANLYAGTYTLIVSDVNGCDDTLTFIMTEPEPISLVAVNAPSFCGLSNGTIDLTVNGGSGFYNYVWTDGNTGLVIGNSEDLFNITGGVYIVAVTDTNGCTMMDTVIVGDKPPVVITGTTTPTNCNGACNGAINVTLVGDGPYIINWTGPNNFSSTDEDLVALCAGTYIITVQDGNSCTVVDTFVITAPNAINITVVANNAATCNASNGSIDISVEGGSGTYSYSWTGPNGFTSTSQDLTGLAEGCYVVTVTDASGCTSTQTICVGSVSALVLNTTPVNVSCNGLNNGSACAEVTGSTPPVSFLWSNGDTTQCTDSLAPGTYVVIVTDANGCTGSDTIVITEPDAIIVAADIPVYPNGYNVSGPDAEDGSIDLTVTGGTVPYTYDWNLPAPNDILEDQVSLPADTYVVVITDANGCTITEEYILTEPPLIELPTGFSPDNGDGLNDFYVIHGIDGLIDNKFTVFNRWGQVIFEKEGYQNDWAGTNFQGRLMPDGTYFILFTVNVPNQGNLTFKATVELRHNLGK